MHLLTRSEVKVVDNIGNVRHPIATAILRRVHIVLLIVHVGKLSLNHWCFGLFRSINKTGRNLL